MTIQIWTKLKEKILSFPHASVNLQLYTLHFSFFTFHVPRIANTGTTGISPVAGDCITGTTGVPPVVGGGIRNFVPPQPKVS